MILPEVIAADGQPGIATTAIVAAGSAVVGAVAGGLASFKANVALDARRRRARAAIRRKAKVYTPLRAELIALERAMGENEHFVWGIDTKERDPEWPQRGPGWRLWPRLTEDGRAATAASRTIVCSLNHVEREISQFEEARQGAFSLLDEVGGAIYEEIVGEAMTIVNAWDSGTALLEVFKDLDDETWYPFQRTKGESQFDEIRTAFNANSRIVSMREQLTERDSQLRVAVSAAIKDLESGMTTIARKHELEEVED